MNIFRKVTLKSLAMNKTRTIVTIIGIILSAAMITAVTTLISSLQDYMLDNAIYIEGDWHGAFYDVDEETIEKLEHDNKVESAAVAENIGYAHIGSSNEYKPYLFIMGGDELFMERMPIHLVSGKLPRTPEEIILPEHLAYNGGVLYKTGDTIQLEIGDRYVREHKLMQNNPYLPPDDMEAGSESDINDSSNGDLDGGTDNKIDSEAIGEELIIKETRTYTVVGFYERPAFEGYSAPGYTAITKIDYNRDSGSYAVYFKMNNPKETFDYVDNSGFAGTTNRDVLMYSGYSRFDNFYTVLYSLAAILIGLIMFGSVSLIYNAFAISVSERTRQFGLLASIGATKRQSRKMVMYEALFVSCIGIPLGILSGILGIGITLSLVGDKFSSFYGSDSIVLDLYVTPASIIIACAVALITVLISAWIPSKRAMKVTAIDAIRLSRDISIKSGNVKTSKITYKLFGLEGMIAKKHFKRSRKKYRATIISLFMSIVLFISASSFCTYLTDAVSSTFQDSDYDIIYHYLIRKEGTIDLDELRTTYNGLSIAKGVISSSYVLSNYFLDCKSPRKLLSDEYVEYYSLPEEITEDAMNVDVYGVGDEVYRQYLKENNLNEEVYMDKDNPRGVAQAV
ncbi:MAG: FtsX-like permease family protein, partial [Clostridiaceae bacterium]|nr:FtsX-like permease family protein [Clostridiaceae bacterium]